MSSLLSKASCVLDDLFFVFFKYLQGHVTSNESLYKWKELGVLHVLYSESDGNRCFVLQFTCTQVSFYTRIPGLNSGILFMIKEPLWIKHEHHQSCEEIFYINWLKVNDKPSTHPLSLFLQCLTEGLTPVMADYCIPI